MIEPYESLGAKFKVEEWLDLQFGGITYKGGMTLDDALNEARRAVFEDGCVKIVIEHDED